MDIWGIFFPLLYYLSFPLLAPSLKPSIKAPTRTEKHTTETPGALLWKARCTGRGKQLCSLTAEVTPAPQTMRNS